MTGKFKSILFTLITLFWVSISFGQNELKKGTLAPGITYQKTFPAKYKIPEGKPIILDFWATWCAPCVAGLLASNEFIGRYADKIDFVAITDETSKNIASFIAKTKLTHHFIVDTTGQTFKKFGVKNIPHAFLIDKNHVIQWSDHASRLTPEMIDEFLKTGAIAEKKTIAGVATAVTDKKVSNRDMQLKITEQKLPGIKYTCSISMKTENFIFQWNYSPLKYAIEELSQMKDRIIFKNLPSTLLKKSFSVDFNAKNIDVQKTKEFLLNSFGNFCSFEHSRRLIDTTVWKLEIADSAKLNQFKTVLTNKKGGYGTGQYESGRKAEGGFTCLNYSLLELTKKLQSDFGVICECNILQNRGYDLFKVQGDDFAAVQRELLDKYGIRFIRRDEKVEFLVIEGI